MRDQRVGPLSPRAAFEGGEDKFRLWRPLPSGWMPHPQIKRRAVRLFLILLENLRRRRKSLEEVFTYAHTKCEQCWTDSDARTSLW